MAPPMLHCSGFGRPSPVRRFKPNRVVFDCVYACCRASLRALYANFRAESLFFTWKRAALSINSGSQHLRNRLGCDNPAFISTMRRRISRPRASLSGEEQTIVAGRGQHAAQIRSAGDRIGIGTADQGFAGPGRHDKRRQFCAYVGAKDALQLLHGEIEGSLHALPFEIERKIAGKIGLDGGRAEWPQLIGASAAILPRAHDMRILREHAGLGRLDKKLIRQSERQTRSRLDLFRQRRPEGNPLAGKDIGGDGDDNGACPQLALARRQHDMIAAAMIDPADFSTESGRHRQTIAGNKRAVPLPDAPVGTWPGIITAEIDDRRLRQFGPGHERADGINSFTPRLVRRQHGRQIGVANPIIGVDPLEKFSHRTGCRHYAGITALELPPAITPGRRRAIDRQPDLFGYFCPGIGARAMQPAAAEIKRGPICTEGMDRSSPPADTIGCFEQHDRKIGPKRLQPPGSSHAGSAGADHGDVDIAAPPGFDGHSISFSLKRLKAKRRRTMNDPEPARTISPDLLTNL
ncbi:hypothetical protein RHSP_26799 [Rhizobium freirei PRF 81]|uniref:Uncharacterized protein n=1 Tax=Rhizobium freirei PRF 81 TaxID=363754 RepID=N6V0D1_9HYPH|nr:hypothetical protein RHSP_26799 [Rhizobium freirei PRF 81]